MELMPMQYKDYVWPHNPRVYTIHYQRQVAIHKVPFGRYAMQDLGLTRRVMTGEGEFWGENAYEEFKKLAAVFYQNGPGTLLHPVWQTARAYFTELTLAQEPRKDYVRYTFTFWEDYDRYNENLTPKTEFSEETEQTGSIGGGGAAQYHTVAQNETLWTVSRDYGLTLGEIMTLNPQIKNPNVVQQGQQIRVR